MTDHNRQSPEQQRANIAATVTRAIGTLHRIQRYLRNPTKNPRPIGGLAPVIARLTAAHAALDALDAQTANDDADGLAYQRQNAPR